MLGEIKSFYLKIVLRNYIFIRPDVAFIIYIRKMLLFNLSAYDNFSNIKIFLFINTIIFKFFIAFIHYRLKLSTS